MSDQRVPFSRLFAYATPILICGAILYPMMAIIPTFYAKYAGISLTVVGTILIVGRLFDAVTDPLIGYLSDITKSPLGKRKPWVLGGLILAMVSIYCLFVPNKGSGALYFLVWYLLGFLAYTIIDIPHRAWGTEISHHYDERSRISSFVGLFSQLGLLTVAIIPLVPIFATQGYTPETLKAVAIFLVVLIPLIALFAMRWGPEGQHVATEQPSVKGLLYSVKGNKPFWYFCVVLFPTWLGLGMCQALTYLYCDSYLQLGRFFPYMLVISAISAFIAIPFWLKIIYKYGKHKAWAVGQGIMAIVFILYPLLDPGEASLIPFLVLITIQSIFTAIIYVAPMAVLGDVIDYDILKTGVNRSASYFSTMTLISKLSIALGAGLGFMMVSAFGYTVAGPNSRFAIFGIAFTTFILPAIFLAVSSITVWFFPIDHRRHTIIRRRIETRGKRATSMNSLKEASAELQADLS
ncbi:MAG: MFS transporter [Deltaproteobacteria bacterium]|nr:MFS transporter [Deltaproteobacteria bacterium]